VVPTHRVAVVQSGSSLFDTPKTLDRMQAHCEAAARAGVELVVFPEAYVGGYPKGMDFGTRIGTRTMQGRDDFRRYWDSSIDVPGPVTDRIGSFAAEMKSHIVVGAIERDGGTLYCSALFFAPDGAYLGKHRKLVPTAAERLIWGRGDGSPLPVFKTAAGTIGAAICWENYMPSLRQTLYAKGINLWCAPTVDDREMWQITMRHIAYEGRTFVLSACQYLTRADVPDDYAVPGSDPAAELIKGGSLIIGPLGDILAGPAYGGEELLTADIDPHDVIRGKYDLDVTGHYARPDIFSLSVNERAQSAVEF
jgi:nitrilase